MNKYRIIFIDRYSGQADSMDINGISEDSVQTAINGIYNGIDIISIDKIE